MKRFRSPFEKIQRIQQQQLRLAELHLARTQAALRDADEVTNQLKKKQQDVEQSIVSRLNKGSQQMQPELMHTMRAHLEFCRVQIESQARHRSELATAALHAEAFYQKQKAGYDGVDQLVQRRKAEHRRQALLNEQVTLDETAMLRPAALPLRNTEPPGSIARDTVIHGVTER